MINQSQRERFNNGPALTDWINVLGPSQLNH